MGIDIISLTPKGEALSHSTKPSNNIGWKAIYFIHRMGNRTTFDKLNIMCYGGNEHLTKQVVSELKSKGIVTGE